MRKISIRLARGLIRPLYMSVGPQGELKDEALLGVLGVRDNWASSTFRDKSLGTFRDKGINEPRFTGIRDNCTPKMSFPFLSQSSAE